MKKFKLGVEVVCKITGFKGIAIAFAEHLTGCDRYFVQPVCKENTDKHPEGQWMDDGTLKMVRKVIEKKTVRGRKRGACAPDPS